MKRIYLDQNKWIDLASAEKGLEKGERFKDALLLLRAAVDAGHVFLPLSSAHYMETHNRRHWESRRDLATTMLALSRVQTIAPSSSLLPGEIDRALNSICGRPAVPSELKPFGVGAAHAMGIDLGDYRLPAELVPRVADRWGLERSINTIREAVLLAGLPPDMEAGIKDYKPLAHLEVGEQGAREKQALRELRETDEWHKGEKSERLAKAQVLTEHIEPLNEGLARARVSAAALYEGGQEGLSAFVEAIPTMFSISELERLRASASQKPWERQDFNDLGALSVASVYCDIVVTERLWTTLAKRAKLDQRLGTVFLSGLEDLPPLLV